MVGEGTQGKFNETWKTSPPESGEEERSKHGMKAVDDNNE